jgi:small subunit ribosomal protein S8
MVTDPIADFLNRLKNAGANHHATALLPYSKIKHDIAKVLEQEGYVGAVGTRGRGVKKQLEITLAYTAGKTSTKPRLSQVVRLSKPSRRQYVKASDLGTIRRRGTIVLTTPRGILTDSQAKKENVGGEVLFRVW